MRDGDLQQGDEQHDQNKIDSIFYCACAFNCTRIPAPATSALSALGSIRR